MLTECPKCGGTHIIGVEYYGGYDGISEWRCEDCGYREGRFSHKELKAGENEQY